MPRPEPRKKPLLLLCCWFFAGALIVASVTALERSFHDLPIELSHLWLPIIFGGIIGVLFGRSDSRMRVMSHRLENSENRFLQFYQKQHRRKFPKSMRQSHAQQTFQGKNSFQMGYP